MKKILKVGFDLDGVILYNPIRFIRPIAKLAKPLKSFLLMQNKESFYFPESRIEKFLFKLIHKTSFRPDHALEIVQKLVKEKKIEAYIVTGRYSFLKTDFKSWLKKINAKSIFKNCYQNEQDLQPNEFKKKMIDKLDLDYYIEDNWDIVEKLKTRPERSRRIKIYWITNILDKNISYEYKFSNLKEALKSIISS